MNILETTNVIQKIAKGFESLKIDFEKYEKIKNILDNYENDLSNDTCDLLSKKITTDQLLKKWTEKYNYIRDSLDDGKLIVENEIPTNEIEFGKQVKSYHITLGCESLHYRKSIENLICVMDKYDISDIFLELFPERSYSTFTFYVWTLNVLLDKYPHMKNKMHNFKNVWKKYPRVYFLFGNYDKLMKCVDCESPWDWDKKYMKKTSCLDY